MKAKQVKLPIIEEDNNVFKERISLEKLREIWNDEENTYSEDELIKIRDWLYAVTEVIYETSKIAEQKIIELKPNNNEETQSNIICEGEYRRAS